MQEITKGIKVRTKAGIEGEVIYFDDLSVTIKTAGGSQITSPRNQISIIEAAEQVNKLVQALNKLLASIKSVISIFKRRKTKNKID